MRNIFLKLLYKWILYKCVACTAPAGLPVTSRNVTD